MTVLERIRANPGTARILVSQLAAMEGRAARTDLLRLVAPPGAGDYEPGSAGDALDETFEVCVNFGLVHLDDDVAVLDVPAERWPTFGTLDGFRKESRRAFFSAVEGKEPFSSGLPKFAAGLAWFLCQEPLLPIIDFELADNPRQSVFGLQQEQLRHADQIFGQDRPWGAFVRWASFLGCLEVLRVRARRDIWIPDPTVAIRDELEQLEGGPAAAVLGTLAEALPVIDGGTVRTAVEERWRSGTPPTHLSRSLSVALLRLEREGILAYPPSADAASGDRVVLHLGEETRTITTILRGEGT